MRHLTVTKSASYSLQKATGVAVKEAVSCRSLVALEQAAAAVADDDTCTLAQSAVADTPALALSPYQIHRHASLVEQLGAVVEIAVAMVAADLPSEETGRVLPDYSAAAIQAEVAAAAASTSQFHLCLPLPPIAVHQSR